jgi:hypothetical protein
MLEENSNYCLQIFEWIYTKFAAAFRQYSTCCKLRLLGKEIERVPGFVESCHSSQLQLHYLGIVAISLSFPRAR